VYTAGNPNTSATFTLTITKDGCTKTCSFEVSNSCSVKDNNGGGDPATDDPCAAPSTTTNSTVVVTEPTQTVESESTEVTISAYPNPFESTLNFEWTATADEEVKLEILDPLGRPLTEVFTGVVRKGETYRFDWTGDGLRDRIHFYRYTSGSKSVRGKLFRR
jgi:hypothetical protein